MEGSCAKLARGLAVVAAFALATAGAAFAETGIDLLPPKARITFSATLTPIPAPSDGRVPVSLRLANSIWTDDGSHPPAATEVRFDLDKQLHFDLSEIPRCPWAPTQIYPAFDWSSCGAAVVASGRVRWEVSFPEQEPLRVGGEVTAYRGMRNRLLIRTYVPAPVGGEVVIPAELSAASEGVYGLRVAATIPEIAAGHASLVYLGLRFRKGLSSATCPKRRLQFGVRNAFSDGEVLAAALLIDC